MTHLEAAGRIRPPSVGGRLFKDRWMYFMLLPGILFFIVFKYGPMFGIVMAFQNYQPYLGFLKSKWVGLVHFQRLLTDPNFVMLFRNTFLLGIYNIVFYFPIPIVLSLMLNEVGGLPFKRTVQTMVYIPHFISWVVVAAITYMFFSVEGGIVNNILVGIGLHKVNPMLSPQWFKPMIIIQLIWKESGWGTIIILAALAGVDPELYDAANVDGAGRWRRLLHITLPSIRSTIVILLILRLCSFMEFSFEQVFLMINPVNRSAAEIFDTYVYSYGVIGAQYSYSAAVGLFRSVVSLALVLIANQMAKWSGEEAIF